MNTTLVMFGLFVLITLSITYWAARRTHTTRDFYAAGRQITGFQNGIAVAGDYMSAASFLGIAGLIAFFGYDGFMYSVGWLVPYFTSAAGDRPESRCRCRARRWPHRPAFAG